MKILLLLLILSFPFNLKAQMKWDFDIKYKFKDKTEDVKLKKKISFKWMNNANGVRVVQWKALIDTPWDLAKEKPVSENKNLELQVKDSRLLMGTTSLSSKINLESGHELEFAWTSAAPVLVEENCDKASLALKAAATEAPFFIGVSCVVENEEVLLHLSFPEEVDLVRSSIFEKTGKGENYRLYDLKKISAAKVKIAEFEFLYNEKRYKYNLNSLKTQSEVKAMEASHFIIGAGQAALSLKSLTLDDKDSKSFIYFQLMPKKIWNDFRWAFTIESTFGNQSNANSLSYYQVAPSLGYSWKFGKDFELQPRLYNVISGQSSATGVGYQTNQIGAGLWTKWTLSADIYILLEAFSEALSSPIIKAHQFAAASFFYDNWGLGFQIQEYSVGESDDNIRKYSQNIISLQVGF